VPKIWGFPLTLIVALTTVLRSTVLRCDKIVKQCASLEEKLKSAVRADGRHARKTWKYNALDGGRRHKTVIQP